MNRFTVVAAIAFVGALALPAHASAPLAKPATADVVASRITLATQFHDGGFAFVDPHKNVNPTLRVKEGDTVELHLTTGEGSQHNFVVDALGVHSEHASVKGGVTLSFRAESPGSFEYYCSLTGHREVGMRGRIEVLAGPAVKTSAAPAVVAHSHTGH